MEDTDIILINRILEGDCSEELIARLRQWIEASDDNRKEFEQYKRLWHSTHSRQLSKEEMASARLQLLQHIENRERVERRTRLRRIVWWTAAAVVAAVVSVTAIYHRATEPKELPLAQVETIDAEMPGLRATVITPDGEHIEVDASGITASDLSSNTVANKLGNDEGLIDFSQMKAAVDTKMTVRIPQSGYYSVKLSDGTRVMLNSGSELIFPTAFAGEKRQVFLTGEAYFEVATDHAHQFVVSTQLGVDIVVHGTSFNVNAYNPSNVETTLVEGSVECKAGGVSVVRLQPNQTVCVHNDGSNSDPTNVDTYLYTAWKDGKFVFDNEPIEHIMSRLAQWYGLEVIYDNDIVKHQKFTGILSRFSNPVDILKRIESTTAVDFYVKGCTIIVR